MSTQPVTSNPTLDQVADLDTAAFAAVDYEWGAIKWKCDKKVTPSSR